ncbi:tyrosine-type recombinase/integrase [Sphingobium sp. SA2]|jgi:integrase|uniref:tyrosine-type recombinase/integrase n=1 Tax=Sphingobium sp. SA2 TaxID=1524832 RepID=UPI0028C091D5|nr:tyrosine-type recombinase/integrase [Sphingobium sp. SA2]MDT7532960.1 tyrosine-type recombinase/integrase [Sphingobium sp. SA2]
MTASPGTALLPRRDEGSITLVDEVRALVGAATPIDTALLDAAIRGWSANTRRAFRSDLTLWGAWCRKRRVAAASATPELVAAWVRALAGTDPSDQKPRAAATIARYLVHVGWAYRMAGLDDPTAAPLVRFEVKAARKTLGTRQRQARALRFKGDIADLDSPASGVCLAHLLKACRRDLLGLRDAALLRVAYDSGCRRSELVGIAVDAIEGPDGEGAGTLFIPTSKTDRERAGAVAYLSPGTMRAIARWREAGPIDKGPLFRRVETHFDGSVRSVGQGALHPNSITLIYKRLIRAAFDKKLLGEMSEAERDRWLKAVSSHSIRVGVAQDNFAAGESLPAIMQAYRWRDPKTVMRYGAKLAAKSGAGARMAARLRDE